MLIRAEPSSISGSGQALSSTATSYEAPAAVAVAAVSDLEGAAGDPGLAAAIGALVPLARQVGAVAVAIGQTLGEGAVVASGSYVSTDDGVFGAG